MKDVSDGILAFGLCQNRTEWAIKKNFSYIQGVITSNIMSYLSVGVYHCTSEFETLYNLTCASEVEMKRLSQGFVSVLFTENVFDPSQKTKPYQPVSKI